MTAMIAVPCYAHGHLKPVMDQTPPDAATDEALQALRDGRSRFVAGFSQRHRAMGRLLTTWMEGHAGPAGPLRESAHKMAGLAGMLGFPTVSQEAAALEAIITVEPLDGPAAIAALARMGAAFTGDLSREMPEWAATANDLAESQILLIEDDHEQRQLVATGLRAAGFRVITAESGPAAIAVAIAERPDLVLLDIDLPGLDGLAVCRRLRLDPALATVPVIFCTARGTSIDRLSAFAVGADGYVTKPYEPAELIMRIRRLLSRPPASSAAPAAAEDDLLTFDLFVSAARETLTEEPACLVLMRVPTPHAAFIIAGLTSDLRRRDLLGRYDDNHLVVLMPEYSKSEARAELMAILTALKPPPEGVAMGMADAAIGGSVEQLIEQSDLALAADRVARAGGQVAKTTLVIADDDPDVLHIIDARLRAEGFRTVLALDGQLALEAIGKEAPAVVILDLMLPKLSGFDILKHVSAQPEALRPQVIVVSARGREDDVARAFELGAEDFLTKPFNPDELVARVARLIR